MSEFENKINTIIEEFDIQHSGNEKRRKKFKKIKMKAKEEGINITPIKDMSK